MGNHMLIYTLYLMPILIVCLIFLFIQHKRDQKLALQFDSQSQEKVEINLSAFDAEIDQILNNPNLSDYEKQQLANDCIERFGLDVNQVS